MEINYSNGTNLGNNYYYSTKFKTLRGKSEIFPEHYQNILVIEESSKCLNREKDRHPSRCHQLGFGNDAFTEPGTGLEDSGMVGRGPGG